MDRIAAPLRQMGAQIDLQEGKAPIRITGNPSLHSIEYLLPVPSAQVKSAVLLAGLYARGTTTVVEPIPTRDHTERMLDLPRTDSDGRTVIESSRSVVPPVLDTHLPGDISSAAFFMAAGLMLENSSVDLLNVGVNPSRSGFFDVLERAGASFEASNHRTVGREPVCDLRITSANLAAIRVTPNVVPRLIDEIPILAVVATQAKGNSSFEGVGELRAKESDRISAVAAGLSRLGVKITVSESSFEVPGPTRLKGGVIDSLGDHRIAMAMAVAGLAADGQTTIQGAEAAAVSYPGFWEDLERLAIR